MWWLSLAVKNNAAENLALTCGSGMLLLGMVMVLVLPRSLAVGCLFTRVLLLILNLGCVLLLRQLMVFPGTDLGVMRGLVHLLLLMFLVRVLKLLLLMLRLLLLMGRRAG